MKDPRRVSTAVRRLHSPVVALFFAALALAAAVVGAIGPAQAHRSAYLWPGTTLGEPRSPVRTWITPLLLQRRHAARLVVELGCPLPPVMSRIGRGSVLVFGTTRKASASGIELILAGPRLQIAVGRRTVASVPYQSRRTGCRQTFALNELRWALTDQAGAQVAAGRLGAPPVVDSLVSDLDVRHGGLTAAVTTEVWGVSPSALQEASDVLAIILVGLALFSAAGARPRIGRISLPDIVRTLRPVDGVVVGFLLLWWVVGPAFYDDGWVRVRQQNYAASGAFSNYFDTWGAALPLVHWLEWLQRWLVASSGAVPALRAVPLVAGLATWTLCRIALCQSVGKLDARRAPVAWAMAAVFALGFAAWGMTLRPEPVVAVFAVAALLNSLRFLRAPGVGPMCLLALIVPLAITAHPAGVAVLAPVLAIAPRAWVWACSGGYRQRLSAIAISGLSLAIVLLFLGSDVAQWREETHLFNVAGAHNSTWRDEFMRYSLLSSPPYGTAPRRLSVALLLVAVAAFLIRAQRRDRRLALPSTTLVLALALLVFTPSKWPWHFGILTGIGAIAFATEVSLFLDQAARSHFRFALRPLAAISVLLLANSWAWAVNSAWNDLDLRTLDWTGGSLSELLPIGDAVDLSSAFRWALLLGLIVAVREAWHIRHAVDWRLGRPIWLAAAWTGAALAASSLAYTAAYYIRDTELTHGWTLTRQNLDALGGTSTCGLGDELAVPRPSSIVALPQARASSPQRLDSRTTVVLGSVRPASSRPPFGRPAVFGSEGRHALASGPWRSPWFVAPLPTKDSGVGLYVTGSFGSAGTVVVDWGRRIAHGVLILRRGLVRVPARLKSQLWQLLTASDLPAPPARANALRLTAISRSARRGAWFGFSAPVHYQSETLASAIRRDSEEVLITPNIDLYFPCATRPPPIAQGIARPPQLSIVLPSGWPFTEASSPFAGLLDAYGTFRLPFDNSPSAQRTPDGAPPVQGEVVIDATEPLPRGDGLISILRDREG